MKTLIIIICILATCRTEAQKGMRYQPEFRMGILEGENGSSFQLQTFQGIRLAGWSAGLGVGIDYYHTRSIPAFLELRRIFRLGEKSTFVYASGGHHFPWEKVEAQWPWMKEAGITGGIYYDAGIGYELPLNSTSLFFTAGYSYKRFTREIPQQVWCITWPCPEVMQTFEYSLRRLSVRTGLRF